ncbi:alpha/beta hydrolase [Auritidibacter ignavus]|uniref:alpha/beta hydrolase n=1 Tax=Auritidibacter ignavus TaxID=678932 RepID=UPI002FE63FEC
MTSNPQQQPLDLVGRPSGMLAETSTGVSMTAVVFHGFTSGPASIAPWAYDLAEHGVNVVAPLLPGHGTQWQDLARTSADEIRAAAATTVLAVLDRQGQQRHAGHTTRLVVGGLSMGGLLALDAAAHLPEIDRVFLVNPALELHRWTSIAAWFTPLLAPLVPNIGSIADDIADPYALSSDTETPLSEHAYPRTPLAAVEQLARLMRTIRGELSKISTPVTVYRSTEDQLVSDRSLSTLRRHMATELLEIVPLPHSRHVATLDADATLIHQHSRATLLHEFSLTRAGRADA